MHKTFAAAKVPKKPISDTFTWHELVQAFGLKADFLDTMDMTDDETYSHAYRAAKAEAEEDGDMDEDAVEEFAMEAASAAEQKALDAAGSRSSTQQLKQ